MKNFLINLLFKLLGNTTSNLYGISFIFGGQVGNHDLRKRKWERALARLWKDKDLLDFLYYQAENDKETAWRGKISKQLSQGARIRTLYIVKSAKLAYENLSKKRGISSSEVDNKEKEISRTKKVYKEIVDIE